MKLPKVSIKKGQILFKEGDDSKSMYYILKGSVDVLVKSPFRSKKNIVNKLEEGDLIGELSFFSNHPRSATLIALEDTELLKLTKELFNSLSPDQAKIYMAMAHKIRKLNNRILNLQEELEKEKSL